MVLIGDSHARQWIPALEKIAEEEGYVAYFLVREGCPAVDQTPWKANGQGPQYDCTTSRTGQPRPSRSCTRRSP